MKHLINIVIIAIISIAFAPGCQKEDLIDNTVTNSENKEIVLRNEIKELVFKRAKLELLEKNDLDIYGLKGDLYINAYDKTQALFEFKTKDNLDNPIIQVDPKNPEYAKCDKATGTYERYENSDGSAWVGCRNSSKDCWFDKITVLNYNIWYIAKCD